MCDKGKEIITNKDRDVNAIKAAFKLIPGGVGEAMIQYFFGKGEEARQRRLEKTLEEIAAKLAENGLKSEIQDNEDFGNFISHAATPIANATNEDKRKRFRDLLFHSMLLPPGEAGWEDSMHCLELLQRIDAVGLNCLARIANAEKHGEIIGVTRYTDTAQWVTVPRNKFDQIPLPLAQEGTTYEFQYSDVLITKNLKKLIHEESLVESRNFLVSAGAFATSIDFYSLSPGGQLLVKWTIADF